MNEISVIPVVGDIYRSNRGKGKELARVTHVSRDRVSLRFVGGQRERIFQLPLWYFSEKVCGWRLADAEPLRVQ